MIEVNKISRRYGSFHSTKKSIASLERSSTIHDATSKKMRRTYGSNFHNLWFSSPYLRSSQGDPWGTRGSLLVHRERSRSTIEWYGMSKVKRDRSKSSSNALFSKILVSPSIWNCILPIYVDQNYVGRFFFFSVAPAFSIAVINQRMQRDYEFQLWCCIHTTRHSLTIRSTLILIHPWSSRFFAASSFGFLLECHAVSILWLSFLFSPISIQAVTFTIYFRRYDQILD